MTKGWEIGMSASPCRQEVNRRTVGRGNQSVPGNEQEIVAVGYRFKGSVREET